MGKINWEPETQNWDWIPACFGLLWRARFLDVSLSNRPALDQEISTVLKATVRRSVRNSDTA